MNLPEITEPSHRNSNYAFQDVPVLFSLKVWSFSILESFTNDNKYEYCSTRYILSAQENAAHILTPSPTEGGKVVAVAHLRSALSSKYFFLKNRIFPKFQGFFLRYSMFK